MKIFNIGKANAEIEKLQESLKQSQEQATALQENASTLEKAAEAEKARADKAESDAKASAEKVSALEKANSQLKAEAEKAKADAEAHCKDFDGKVAKAAAEKSVQITAAQGQPPIVVQPKETAAAKAELTGLARVKAEFEAQLAANK